SDGTTKDMMWWHRGGRNLKMVPGAALHKPLLSLSSRRYPYCIRRLGCCYMSSIADSTTTNTTQWSSRFRRCFAPPQQQQGQHQSSELLYTVCIDRVIVCKNEEQAFGRSLARRCSGTSSGPLRNGCHCPRGVDGWRSLNWNELTCRWLCRAS